MRRRGRVNKIPEPECSACGCAPQLPVAALRFPVRWLAPGRSDARRVVPIDRTGSQGPETMPPGSRTKPAITGRAWEKDPGKAARRTRTRTRTGEVPGSLGAEAMLGEVSVCVCVWWEGGQQLTVALSMAFCSVSAWIMICCARLFSSALKSGPASCCPTADTATQRHQEWVRPARTR